MDNAKWNELVAFWVQGHAAGIAPPLCTQVTEAVAKYSEPVVRMVMELSRDAADFSTRLLDIK